MNDLLRDKAPDVHAAIRAAGGIVHSDGNIFFTSAVQFFAAATSLRAAAPVVQQGVSDKLLPCPFCGSHDAHMMTEQDEDGFGFFLNIECGTCRAATGQHYVSHGNDCPQARAEVRAAWNRRASLAQAAPAGVPADLISAADAHADMYEGSEIPARDVRAAITNAFYAGASYAAPAGVPLSPARWHELKTDPDLFDAVADGRKTFEIRLNDRDYKVGDGLLLRRTRDTGWAMKNTGAPLEYTGQEFRVVVTHVLDGYGLQPGWVILSFTAFAASTDAPLAQQDDKAVALSAADAAFLAARLRRLFKHFDYPLPAFAQDDASLIGIAGSAIGAVLAASPAAPAPAGEQK